MKEKVDKGDDRNLESKMVKGMGRRGRRGKTEVENNQELEKSNLLGRKRL